MIISKLNNNNIYCPNYPKTTFLKKQNCVSDLKNEKNVNFLNSPNGYYNQMQIAFGGNIILNKNDIDHYKGCLVGGAIADALGANIEAWTYDDIQKTFGCGGLRNLLTRNGVAKITDDTQMSLFTASALIKEKLKNKGEIDINSCLDEIASAYKDWSLTQKKNHSDLTKQNDILLNDDRLYSKRFPGVTCIEALKNDVLGSIENPINDSAGNGGVMRCAPIGLILSNNPDFAFELGAKSASLTHGNPRGYLPAGALAYIIANIINGNSIMESAAKAIDKLKSCGNEGKEIAKLLKKAVELSKTEGENDAENIKTLGKGFVGDEALAIALYSALKYENNFRLGVICSVNHDGDSDTTGSIAGNILGASLGEAKLPLKFKNKIELSDLIQQIAQDLYLPIDEIENPEEKYGYNPVFSTLKDRQSENLQNSTTSDIIFSEKDRKILDELPLKEAIAYKRYLIKNHLYETN